MAASPAVIFFFRQAEIFLARFANAQTPTSRLTHSIYKIDGPPMDDKQISVAESSQAAQRQVRVQLTSQQEDIALPDNTGPILVPTGQFMFKSLTMFESIDQYTHYKIS